jgi:hypothetical protein
MARHLRLGSGKDIDPMLRISTAESSPRERTLILEGRVIGPWTEELSRLCGEMLAARLQLTLDLGQVSFVDADGIALLRDLRARRVELQNCSALVCEQLKG